jgi:hypothetical protein
MYTQEDILNMYKAQVELEENIKIAEKAYIKTITDSCNMSIGDILKDQHGNILLINSFKIENKNNSINILANIVEINNPVVIYFAARDGEKRNSLWQRISGLELNKVKKLEKICTINLENFKEAVKLLGVNLKLLWQLEMPELRVSNDKYPDIARRISNQRNLTCKKLLDLQGLRHVSNKNISIFLIDNFQDFKQDIKNKFILDESISLPLLEKTLENLELNLEKIDSLVGNLFTATIGISEEPSSKIIQGLLQKQDKTTDNETL